MYIWTGYAYRTISSELAHSKSAAYDAIKIYGTFRMVSINPERGK